MSDDPHNAACRAYAKISGHMADGAAINSALAAWCEVEAADHDKCDESYTYGAWLHLKAAALRGDSAS